MQYSSIVDGYQRLFIEVKQWDCINFDLTIGATFKMEQKDFDDWASDAEVMQEADIPQALKDIGIDYEKFVIGIQELK